jgi:hypothetical protein
MSDEVYGSDYPEPNATHEDRARAWCDGENSRPAARTGGSRPNVGGFFEGERLDRVVSKLLQGGARPGDDEPLAKAIMLVGIFEDMEGAGFVFRREEP